MIELDLPNTNIKALLDDNFKHLTQLPWFLSKDLYVMMSVSDGFTYMHHLIIGYPATGLVTDHKNRITYDNQTHNLHHVTHQQNMCNRERKSSQYLGVSWEKTKQRWQARIKKDNKTYCLGRFRLEQDAALAYDAKAFELYGLDASLNFPDI